jgi:hypothetical protein
VVRLQGLSSPVPTVSAAAVETLANIVKDSMEAIVPHLGTAIPLLLDFCSARCAAGQDERASLNPTCLKSGDLCRCPDNPPDLPRHNTCPAIRQTPHLMEAMISTDIVV